MENSARLLEDSLLLIWNDRDAARRSEAMQRVYATDIVFYETHEGPAISGHEAINALITGLQSKWPAEFKFMLSSPSRMNHEVQQISWTLGIPGQPPVASGMDIAITKDDRIVSLHLFLDAPGK